MIFYIFYKKFFPAEELLNKTQIAAGKFIKFIKIKT